MTIETANVQWNLNKLLAVREILTPIVKEPSGSFPAELEDAIEDTYSAIQDAIATLGDDTEIKTPLTVSKLTKINIRSAYRKLQSPRPIYQCIDAYKKLDQ